MARGGTFIVFKPVKKPARIDESMEVATAVQYSLTYVVREFTLAAKLRCPTESPWS
jgi:hypothetical protein